MQQVPRIGEYEMRLLMTRKVHRGTLLVFNFAHV